MAETVTVACGLPHGLLLRVFAPVKVNHALPGGGSREVDEFRDVGAEPVHIKGWSHPQDKAPAIQLVNGFALTPNVDKAFFEKWMSQNKDHHVVKSGLIFAQSKGTEAAAEAKDKKTLKSGLERLDPDKLPKGLKKYDKNEVTA